MRVSYKKFLKNKKYVGLIVAIMFLVGISVVDVGSDKPEQKSLTTEAEALIELCQSQDHVPKCYDEEIPKLMDRGYSMEEAFAVTAIIQEHDKEYQYCHVLGHELSAKETAKDPSLWKDVVARAPLGQCSNGGVHGAFQERFRVESFGEGREYLKIVPELEGVCDPREAWQPTRMGQATCIHALGHLTMYATDARITNALELCRLLLDDKDESSIQLCYDGAFMQIYQPLEPEDFALIEGKEIETREESVEFCAQFEGAEKGSCIGESWPLYYTDLRQPNTILSVCDRAKFNTEQHFRCLNGVFYVAMAQANLSTDWAKDFCSQVDESFRGTCYGNSASRLIEVDARNIEKALYLCSEATDLQSKEACYDELLLYSDYTFLPQSPEFFELCNGMPEDWKTKCLQQVKNFNQL